MKMKKVFAAAAAVSMAFALAACNKAVDTGAVTSEGTDVIVLSSETVSEAVSEVVEDGAAGAEAVDEAAFVGTWVSGRAAITIEPDGNGYSVNIHWGSSAFEAGEWEYFCLFDGEKLMNHGDGVYKIVTYSEDGTGTEEVQYEDGAVTFTLSGDKLLWNDEKENVADGVEFEKTEIVDAQ